MRASWYIAGGVATACACAATPSFVCTSNAQCGAAGTCEPTGFCSFADDQCESGQRYEPKASGDLAGRCVPTDDGSSGSSTTTDDGSAAASSSDSADTGESDVAVPSTGGEPERPRITVNPTVRFQTIDGMGVQAWDYPIANANDWNWDAAAPAFDDVDLYYAQLITLFSRWEPDNDNDNASLINERAFDPFGDIAGEDLPMAQFLGSHQLGVTVQNVQVPGWLLGETGEILPENYEEFAESVTSYHQYLDDRNVSTEAIEIARVGAEGQVLGTPAAAVAAGERLVSSMQVFALDRPLLTPSVPGVVADEWLAPWFDSPTLTEATIAISVRGQATSDLVDFQSVAQWSQLTGKPVWAYDNWYCGADEGCPAAPAEDSTTWATAWEMAQQNWRLIVHAHASRIYHAAMVGAQPSVVPETGEKNPTFFVLQHFANWIPEGSVLLEARSDVAEVWPVVIERPDGTMSLIVLNTGFVNTQIDLHLAAADISVVLPPVQSIAGQYVVQTPAASVDGAISLTLPTNSLTSVHFAHD